MVTSTSTEQENSLERLCRLRKDTQFYFLASLPGAIPLIVALPFFLQQYRYLFDHPATPEELPTYFVFPIIFLYSWFFFEKSEENMEKLKIEIRVHLKQFVEPPIHYTMIEQFVNLVMKLAWDCFHLPQEKNPGKIHWILPKT